jgi:hypothetical protein
VLSYFSWKNLIFKVKYKLKSLDKTSKNYGHDKILKNYISIPYWFPLDITIQHGWYLNLDNEIESKKNTKYILVWSQRIADSYSKKNIKNKIIKVLGCPFVIHRKAHNINIKDDARGTVFFPQHASKNSKILFEMDELAHELHKLPEEFKPITICLHYVDYDNFIKKSNWEKHGFKVVTAGNSRQKGLNFVNNFYEILTSHKYSSSNDIGSYLFYSVEADIPFFLYGKPPKIIYNFQRAEVDEKRKNEVIKMFSEKTQLINKVQKKFVIDEVGETSDVISPVTLKKLVKSSFFRKIFNNFLLSFNK